MKNAGEAIKVGYGRDRSERDFLKHGVAARWVFIDTGASERIQRAKAMQYLAVMREQGRDAELVLLSWGDLGHGVDMKRQREKLDEMGVTVTIPGRKPKRRKGRPKGTGLFAPTPEHDAEIRAAWHDDGRTLQGVINIAAGHGYTVTQAQLKYRYGNRFK